MTITNQKFYLPSMLKNDQGSLPVTITARIGQSGHLLMSKPDSCEIISKSDQWFLRTRFFFALYRHVFLHVCIVQKAQSHIYRQIKILQTIFEKGHPRNIPVKLFQNLTSGFGEKNAPSEKKNF